MQLTLSTRGDGLMETHVTWTDIEEWIESEKGVKVEFGPNRKLTPIGEGQGFMSRLGVIEADWQGDSAGVPERFVIKIATRLSAESLGDAIREMNGIGKEEEEKHEAAGKMFEVVSRLLHNTEVDTYSLLTNHATEDANTLQIFFSRKFTEDNPLRGFIGMEFVDDNTTRHVYNNVTPNELKDALRAVARLQACGQKFTADEKTRIPNRFRMLYSTLMAPECLSNIYTGIVKGQSPELVKKGEVLKSFVEELSDTSAVDTLNSELGMEDVFIHGDLWSANLMWKKQENSFTITRIIDYQISHFGCAAEDLVRVIVSSLSGKDRREHWEELLEYFHKQLALLVEADSMPYTLEQLKESYRRMFPLAATVFLAIMGPIAQIGSKNLSDEELTKVDEVMNEKLECIYEDIIHYHQRNVSLKTGE